jgi:hypothetical protein
MLHELRNWVRGDGMSCSSYETSSMPEARLTRLPVNSASALIRDWCHHPPPNFRHLFSVKYTRVMRSDLFRAQEVHFNSSWFSVWTFQVEILTEGDARPRSGRTATCSSQVYLRSHSWEAEIITNNFDESWVILSENDNQWKQHNVRVETSQTNFLQ